MTSFDDFKKQIQTFGSARADRDPSPWARTPEGAAVIAEEHALDDLLDTSTVPDVPDLIGRICAAALTETQRLMPTFIRLSTAASILTAIGGFMLGRSQMIQNLVDSQYYFTAMFDIGY